MLRSSLELKTGWLKIWCAELGANEDLIFVYYKRLNITQQKT